MADPAQQNLVDSNNILQQQAAARGSQGGGQVNIFVIGLVAFGVNASNPEAGVFLNSIGLNSALGFLGRAESLSVLQNVQWGFSSMPILGDIIAKMMEGKDVSASEMSQVSGIAASLPGVGVSANQPTAIETGQIGRDGIPSGVGAADDYRGLVSGSADDYHLKNVVGGRR